MKTLSSATVGAVRRQDGKRKSVVGKKEQIIEKLKENGCRITKQRQMLIDIILENDCSSCKEIFYKASKTDSGIGVATVYRMVNALEDIGAISRKNMYKVEYPGEEKIEDSAGDGCVIVLDDNTTYHLSQNRWNTVIREGMKQCGYLKDQKITQIKMYE